jgi:hypothetical protein
LHMGRPNRDRVMVSFYISRADKQAIERLAAERGMTKADMYRELLRVGMNHADWRRNPRTQIDRGAEFIMQVYSSPDWASCL